MPELPEVETTRRGLEPHIVGKTIKQVILRRDSLRWPIPFDIVEKLPGQKIMGIERRAKYLLMSTKAGSALWHLGMSGSMRVLNANAPIGKHDHVDIVLSDNKIIRYTDPRRFGCLLWQKLNEIHPLLQKLGPEPLTDTFNGEYLFTKSRNKHVAVKSFLMDQAVVEENCLIAAGAVVLENFVCKNGGVYAGIPARRVKELSPELFTGQIERISNNYVMYASWLKF